MLYSHTELQDEEQLWNFQTYWIIWKICDSKSYWKIDLGVKAVTFGKCVYLYILLETVSHQPIWRLEALRHCHTHKHCNLSGYTSHHLARMDNHNTNWPWSIWSTVWLSNSWESAASASHLPTPQRQSHNLQSLKLRHNIIGGLFFGPVDKPLKSIRYIVNGYVWSWRASRSFTCLTKMTWTCIKGPNTFRMLVVAILWYLTIFV